MTETERMDPELRELVGTLDALSSDEAEEAKYLLIGRGPAIVPGLAASLADLTGPGKVLAVEVFSALGDRRACPGLITLLDEDDGIARRAGGEDDRWNAVRFSRPRRWPQPPPRILAPARHRHCSSPPRPGPASTWRQTASRAGHSSIQHDPTRYEHAPSFPPRSARSPAPSVLSGWSARYLPGERRWPPSRPGISPALLCQVKGRGFRSDG